MKKLLPEQVRSLLEVAHETRNLEFKARSIGMAKLVFVFG